MCMKKILSVFVIFSLLGCVTAESVKTLSDYELCYEDSSGQFTDNLYKIYGDEVDRRESLDCSIYANEIAEYKRKQAEQSAKLKELSATLNRVNDNQSGRSSTQAETKTTNYPTLTTWYPLETSYVSGYNRICVYNNGRKSISKSISSYSKCQTGIRE